MKIATYPLRWPFCLLLLLGFLSSYSGAYAAPSRPPVHLAGPTPQGNYVFRDNNQNNIFDAAETGIPNVQVNLYTSTGVLRETTLTTSTGQFSFTSTIQPNTSYDIRITGANAPANLKLVQANQGSDDFADSDASLIGNTAVIVTQSSPTGTLANNFGFGYTAGDPDLSLTNASNSFSVTKGATATCTITVSNFGGSTASNVVIRDTLDLGLEYVSSSPSGTTALLGSGQIQVTWVLGTLAAGASTTFLVTTRAINDGVLSNTAGVSSASADATPRNNVARTCFTVPVKLCVGDTYVTSLSANLANVEWFRDGTSVGTGNSLTIATAGTYSYTSTTVGSDCQAGSCCPIIIYNGALPNLTVALTSTSICAGASTVLTAANCTGVLTWSTGVNSTSISVSPLITTSYSVTCSPSAADACPASATATVTVNPSVTATLSSATICNGNSATLIATGGVSYRFGAGNTNTTGQLTVSPTTIGANPYSVTVTSAEGCSAVANASVLVNPLPQPTIAGNTTLCTGQPISLTSSPTTGLTYAWSGPGGSLGSANPLTIANSTSANSGTYQVLVTDVNGCTATATYNVTVKPVPVVQIINSSITCSNNQQAVAISTQVTGGSPPVSYAWYRSGAAGVISTAPNPVFNTPDTYSVVVTDASGCVSNTASVTVMTPDPLAVNTQTANALCFNAQGLITVTTSGGTAPYTVRYSNSGGPISTTTTSGVSTLQTVAGSYTITIADANGCSLTQTATITQPPLLTVTLTSGGPVCEGQTTGTIASSVTGGTSPYSYSWSNGATTANVSSLSGGSYSVVVTDANGCVTSQTITITTNPLPNAPTVSVTQPTCVTLTGTIQVLTPASGVQYSFNNGISYQLSSTQAGLQPDVYQLRVKDNITGCVSLPTSVTINPVPSPPVASIAGNTVYCAGSPISLTASPATGVTYVWSGPAGSLGSANPLVVATTSAAQSGVYQVTVTDVNGCTATASATITVNPAVTATVADQIICNGTTATLTANASGGAGFTYNWSPAGTGSTQSVAVSPAATTTYSVTVTNNTSCSTVATATVTVNPSVTATLSSATICNGLSATLIATGGTSYSFSDGTINGTGVLVVSPTATTPYSVTVANIYGCTTIATGTVTVNPAVTATVANSTICNGTTATLSVTAAGGTGFTYSWSPAGTGSTQSVAVSPSATTTYTVVVTNSDGCSTTATATVTVNPSVTATLSSATICDGLSATLVATGGTSYSFSNGTVNTTGILVVSPSATTAYSVIVANGFGCTGTASGTVTINPAVTATVANSTICYGTSATLTASASGGTGFSYNWSPAGTGSTQTVTVSPLVTTPYTVTVTNSFGCSAIATATVTVNPAVTATVADQIICNGTSTTLTANAAGGSGFTYNWSPVGTGSTQSVVVSPSATTTYTVVVTNSFGCSTTATATVTVNPSVTATLSSATICDGLSATLVATGGTSYSFSDGTINGTGILVVSPTATTPYSVTVANIFGCTGTASGTVTVNPAVTATVANSTICYGTSATLTASASGGTGFSYNWSPAGTGSTQTVTVSPLVTTPYTVTVTNSFGCSAIATATVTVNPAVTATVADQIICNGTSTTLTANASGGTGFSYSWSPAGTGNTQSVVVSPAATTTYTVVVTNSDGCSTTATATVTINPSVTATLSSATICNGTSATLIATGGTSYSFSDGTINGTGILVVSPTATTPYSVTVANIYGCTTIATGTVTVNPAVTATVANSTICNGTTATLSVTAAGGTGFTYNWSPAGTGSTQSVAVSPSATTTYTVVVTNSDGCSTTATATVTVNPSVTATLSSATICDGLSATLVATGGTSYSFSNGTVNTTGILVVSPSATTAYSVIVANGFGCTGTASGTVTINPAVTATVANSTICYGTSATLTANASGGTGFTYAWSPAGTGSTQTVTVSPLVTTPYTVTVTNSFGCSAIATATVTVNPAVTATVADQIICNGTSTTLTANASGGTGFTYNWSPAGTGNTQSVAVSPTATTTYTVVVTNSDGCSTTATATVTINPSVTATLSSATICNGLSATLIATGGTSYSFSDGTINGTGILVVSPAATTPYSVTVANIFGCTGTASGTVTVNPAVTATVANSTICYGTSTTLTVNATGGTGFTYAFSTGTVNTTGSLVVSPLATTLYSVTVTNSDGCSVVTTATVTVNPATTATIGVAPSLTICEGNTVQLTATGTGGTSYSYLWSTAQATQAISVTPAVTTVYSVTVSNTDTGCAAVASTTITVNPTPVLTVNSPTICQESSATLSLTGCAGTVTWSTGTTGAILEVTPLQTTSYTATCVLTTGCSATIVTTVTVTPAPTVDPANVVATRATCNGATANNDASIALTGLQNTARVSISAADGTTVPDFASAIPVTGAYTFANLPNPTQRVTYLIRLYGVDGICTSTVTVTLDPAACTCPAPGCVPIMIRKIR